MRKLKLQVQMSVDGFVAGPKHEMDWMTWTWDEKLKKHVLALTDSIDTIIMGRGMSDGFLGHWENIVDNVPNDPEYVLAQKMVDIPKVIFGKSITSTKGRNAVVNNGDLAEEVNKLKNQKGKDIIVYGGANFNASLIKAGLIDEFHLFINPAAIGKGMPIFNTLETTQHFNLVKATAFDCGIVILEYTKK